MMAMNRWLPHCILWPCSKSHAPFVDAAPNCRDEHKCWKVLAQAADEVLSSIFQCVITQYPQTEVLNPMMLNPAAVKTQAVELSYICKVPCTLSFVCWFARTR